MSVIVIILMIAMLLCGFPMLASFAVGAFGLILAIQPSLSMTFVIQQFIAGISGFTLLSIPMFIFAAEIMSFGRTANHLVDLVKAFVGHISGGLAITVAGACTIFGAISGSSNATVVAIGKPMRSRMIENGYDQQNTDALICASAIIAVLIPPSINMIMYCVLTGTSVGELFVAGVIPRIFVFLLFAVYNYFYANKKNIPKFKRVSWKERIVSVRKSILALGFPVLIIGGIYSGTFTPTEAAAVSVIYAMLCEMLIYRTVNFKDLLDLAKSTGIMTSAIFVLIAVGQGFSWVISYFNIPKTLTIIAAQNINSTVGMAILVSLAFFIACMFVDQIVAMLILLPIIFPMTQAMGMDPVYIGVLVSIQAAIGSITPPFGSNIFVACAAFDRPYLSIVKGLPAYLIILVFVSVIYIAFPNLAIIHRLL